MQNILELKNVPLCSDPVTYARLVESLYKHYCDLFVYCFPIANAEKERKDFHDMLKELRIQANFEVPN